MRRSDAAQLVLCHGRWLNALNDADDLTAHAQGMTSFWITGMMIFPTADDFLIDFNLPAYFWYGHHVSPSRFGDSKFDQAQRQTCFSR